MPKKIICPTASALTELLKALSGNLCNGKAFLDGKTDDCICSCTPEHLFCFNQVFILNMEVLAEANVN